MHTESLPFLFETTEKTIKTYTNKGFGKDFPNPLYVHNIVKDMSYSYVNQCSVRSMELLLSDLLGNYDKPTNQLTNISGQREVTLSSKENLQFLYIFGKQNIYSFDAEHLENLTGGLFDLICMDILRLYDNSKFKPPEHEKIK